MSGDGRRLAGPGREGGRIGPQRSSVSGWRRPRLGTLSALVLVGTLATSAEADPIAELVAKLPMPTERCNPFPLYQQVDRQVTDGTLVASELKSGTRIEEYDRAAACAAIEAPPTWHLVVHGSEAAVEDALPIDLRLPLDWCRGLSARLTEAGADRERAGEEVRRTLIVSLHFYRWNDTLLYRLIGLAMLRVTAQEALRTDLDWVAANRALLDAVVAQCQDERQRFEETRAFLDALAIYRELPGHDDRKLRYDFLGLVGRAVALRHEPLGFEHFRSAVRNLATVDDDEDWKVFWAVLPRLRDSRNPSLAAAVNGFFAEHDAAEARRLLSGVDFGRR